MQIVPKTAPSPAIAPPAGTGDVLVVDDDADQVALLAQTLAARGHQVRCAEHGQQALDLCAHHPPDVVLLDVMMPGIDGVETCRRLKSDAATAHIPVLLVTSLSERADRLRGIQAGANDFITKPLDIEALHLRVRNAIQGKQLFDRLRDDNQRLLRSQSLRDNLTHLVVHDMKAPLEGIDRAIRHLHEIGTTTPASVEAIGTLEGAAAVLQTLGQSLLDFNRMELHALQLHRASCDVAQLARETAELVRPLACATCTLEVRLPPNPVRADADHDVLCRVVLNLLWNAITHAPPSSTVEMVVTNADGDVTVSVTDRGPTLAAKAQGMVFDIFHQSALYTIGQGRSAGPSIAYCRLAVAAHNGRIGVDSSATGGTRFWFTVPSPP
jgi:two-component system sensor histidine kinase/response regulator